nr:alpha/beta hydrolase [Ectobacillus ponti]
MVLAFSGFYIWSEQTYKPTDELYTLVPKQDMEQNGDFLVFQPKEAKNIGIVLYPGAKVEPAAYSYYAKGLAAAGYTVIIPRVAFHFALLDVNKAKEAIAAYPSVKTWYTAGHSLGGVAAASYAYGHQKEIAGVIFLGSYPAASNDFSKTDVPMLSLYAEYDGLSTISKIDDTKHLLSKKAELYEIQGGNHAQFGIYGKQKGDHDAKIPAKQQQDEMIAATANWLAAQ